MKTTRLIAWVLCAAPLAVAADGRRPPFGRQGFNRTADPRDFRAPQPLSDEEWEQVLPWAQKFCKNRVAFIDHMPNEPQRERARRLIYNRYHQIMSIPSEPVRKVVQEQVRVQDEIFGAQIDLRVAHRSNNPQQEQNAQATLKAAVKELVQVQIEDKRVRIARLKTELDKLTKDPDQLAEQWYKEKLARVYGQAPSKPQDDRATESAAPDDSQSPDAQ